MSVASLFAALEAAGARLALSEDGEGLTLSGKRPPAALLEAVRAERAALLAHLRGAAKEEAAPAPASSSPDVARLAQTPGHCGCCARWTPTGYPLEGECSAGRRAHGWPDGNPDAPVLTTPHHTCAAYSGQGWKAREGRA